VRAEAMKFGGWGVGQVSKLQQCAPGSRRGEARANEQSKQPSRRLDQTNIKQIKRCVARFNYLLSTQS
jgi:hypothetical protein